MNILLGRTIHGWSQEQLALECGLKRTYIGALERGEINPGVDNLDRLALGLRVPSHVLLLSPDEAQSVIYRLSQKIEKVPVLEATVLQMAHA